MLCICCEPTIRAVITGQSITPTSHVEMIWQPPSPLLHLQFHFIKCTNMYSDIILLDPYDVADRF